VFKYKLRSDLAGKHCSIHTYGANVGQRGATGKKEYSRNSLPWT